MTRRGVDRSRLALVSPPEAAPSAHAIQSSPPSAAAFAFSKSSRAKYAETRTSPTSPEEHPPSHHSSHTHAHIPRSHGRSSSEATATATSHSTKTPTLMGKASFGETPRSPRDIGIVGTVRTMAKRSDLEARIGNKHRRRESTGNASSGSDYGDEPTAAKPGDSANKPTFSPVFQKSGQDAPSSQRSLATGSSSVSHGMHIPLPAVPRTFGALSNHTPLLTPAIGDSKPIDSRVAAPVVVDIRGELADLWLAATPDGDLDFSSAGSPMTATTTTTESSFMPTSLSTASSGGQSSAASPLKTRTQHYDPVLDATAGPVPLPPRHIDINSLAAGSSPVCPPRPQRQPSPAQRPVPLSAQEGDPMSTSTSSLVNRKHGLDTPRADVNASDSKYALLAVSDDESSSDYSNDLQYVAFPLANFDILLSFDFAAFKRHLDLIPLLQDPLDRRAVQFTFGRVLFPQALSFCIA